MNSKKSGPQLFPETTLLFRTPAQMQILAKVVLDKKVSNVSELASFAGIARHSARAEVDRLEQFGFVYTEQQGNNKLVHNKLQGPLLEAVTTLLMYAVGPTKVIPEEFSQIAGVEQLIIFGSWASRYLKVSGKPPGDIDLLVIGNPDGVLVAAAALRIKNQLNIGLELNPMMITTQSWADEEDAFLMAVKQKPLINLEVIKSDILLDTRNDEPFKWPDSFA